MIKQTGQTFHIFFPRRRLSSCKYILFTSQSVCTRTQQNSRKKLSSTTTLAAKTKKSGENRQTILSNTRLKQCVWIQAHIILLFLLFLSRALAARIFFFKCLFALGRRRAYAWTWIIYRISPTPKDTAPILTNTHTCTKRAAVNSNRTKEREKKEKNIHYHFEIILRVSLNNTAFISQLSENININRRNTQHNGKWNDRHTHTTGVQKYKKHRKQWKERKRMKGEKKKTTTAATTHSEKEIPHWRRITQIFFVHISRLCVI